MWNKVRMYLKSRTVWMGVIAAGMNLAAMFQIDKLAGMPIEEIQANQGQLASQLTVIAAGVFDVLTIVFRIKAKAKFD